VLKGFTQRPGTDAEWSALNAAAAALPAPKHLLDTADSAFVNPSSMRAAINAQLQKNRAVPPKNLAGYVRLICESLGASHAKALQSFERLADRRFKRILVVGGGSRNRLMCQATANAAGVPLVSFSLEGTAVGNIARQLIALGAVKDLSAFRELLGRRLERQTYQPRSN